MYRILISPLHRTGKKDKKICRSTKTSYIRSGLRKDFPGTYRNDGNTNKLFGRLVALGRAYTILVPVMFGFNFPAEKGQYLLRERHFKSVAYTLTEEETQMILEADEDKK